MPFYKNKQKGSALILAMLIVGIVAVLAVQFAQAFVLQSSRLENRLLQSRFETYLHGAQVLAAQVLLRDGVSTETDNLQEPWAMGLPPLETDDGWLQVSLSDAQGRFNLNNLSLKTTYFDDVSAPATLRFSAPQKQFIRLLQSLSALPVTEAEAIQIVEAMVDWLDIDDVASGAGGAESLYYTTLTPGYQPANQFFVDVSELRLVRHVTSELLQQLTPMVVALPEVTSLNLNTALAPLLGSVNRSQILAPLSREEIERLLRQQQQYAYGSVDDVFDGLVFADFKDDIEKGVPSGSADESVTTGIPPVYSVTSDYFVMNVIVTIGERTRRMQALLQRTETDVITLSRHQGI